MKKDGRMQVTETLNDGLRRGYTITVTAAELEAKVDEKLKEAQPEIELKGFRKGKVPFKVLKQQFGKRVLADAMQETVDGAMRVHFEETGDRPALQPEVKLTNENWQEGEDVTVSLAYEALPAVPEVDLAAIALERMVVKADDAAIDEALGKLAESAQNFADRDEGAAAQSGDQVVIDFEGAIDGTPFEGGAAEDYPLVLGSGSFIPGFEEQLEGVTVGTEKTVTVAFPEEYGAKHLAGKEAQFACKVKAVKAPEPAPLDDAFAQRFGAEDLAALKTQIAERLGVEYGQAARMVLKRKLLDALDGMVGFELPPSMTEAEAKQIAHQLWHEEHPEVHGHDHAEIAPSDEHLRLAERRVRLGLLLADIGNRAGVEVTDAEFTQAVMAQARQYPGNERAFFDFVRGNAGVQQQIRAPLFEDKVVDHILAQASVTETEVTREALKAAVDALDDEAPAAT
jgi:trigger factor